MMIRGAAVLLVVALSSTAVGTQQPTFRARVDLVEIDAVVTDASGNPVSGLTAEDFEILEGGRRQAIAAFSKVDIPIERAERPLFSPTAIEPDVLTNQREEGRVYLIAFDTVTPLLALRTRRFLRTFIEQHLGTNDVAGISYLSLGASNSQDFTSNKRLLLGALDRFTGEIPPDAPAAPAPGGDGGGLPNSLSPTNEQLEARATLRARMRTFRDIVEFLERVPGRRKALIYITTGDSGAGVIDAIDYRGGVMSIEVEDAHAALRAAVRGSIAIYPIDPRGLAADGGSGESEAAEDVTAVSGRAAARLAQISHLRVLAEATGGFAFTNQNTYDQAFTRLVRENSSYYVLGFYSSNDRRDGRFRQVQVRVTRPGLQVRARNGYVAPRGNETQPATVTPSKNLSAAVSAALASPVAARGVPLRMVAAPFKGPERAASVVLALGVGVEALNLTERDGRFIGEIEIATAAAGARNKLTAGEFHQVKVALLPETMDRARRQGLQILGAIELPAGRYQIRTAVGNRVDRAGSVVYDIEVPDFTKGDLTMSGVMLTSSGASRLLTVATRDPLRDLLPGPPTTAREFSAGETITLFAEVYDNARTPAAHTVDLQAVIRADDGRILQTVSEQRSSSELKGSAGGYGFEAALPLEGLAPGLYVVHVEARLNTGSRTVVSRDVEIRVR
jgi:VWFA-related protein